MTRTKYFKMGLGVFIIYLLLCAIVLTRMPSAAMSFSINGMLAALLSFCIIAWCSARKCSLPLAMAIVFLLNIGACAQCVISKTDVVKQALIFAASSVIGLISVAVWDFVGQKLSDADRVNVLKVTAGLSVLLYVVLLIFGTRIHGAKAWLFLGKLSLQLTEPAKLIAVLFFAVLFSYGEISDPKKIAVASGFYALNAIFLAFINELGTLLVITFVFIAMCFLFIRSRIHTLLFLVVVAFILCAGYMLIHSLSARAAAAAELGMDPGKIGRYAIKIVDKLNDRFELWLHLDTLDSKGIAYQSLKARDAIMVGGLFGSPLNVYIPYSGSDFIFPSLMLRFGLVMGIVVFLLFLTIYYYGMAVCLSLSDTFAQTMCAGCALCIVLQALLMIFGSTNFFIMTGIPVPFLSAGGSAQVIVFIMSALLIHFSEGTEGASGA